MKAYYAPDTNCYYERDEPGDPSHIEVPLRPSPLHEYNMSAGEWTLSAEAEALIERREAEKKFRDRYAVSMRLTLWLMRYVWPKLTAEEKGEIRQIIPEEMENEIRTALEKLP